MELNFSAGAACARELIKSGAYRRGAVSGAALRRLNRASRGLREICEAIRAADARELPQELEGGAEQLTMDDVIEEQAQAENN